MNTILAETSPASWPPFNGGLHRTRQIYEIITDAGITIAPIPQEQPCPNPWKYLLGALYLIQTGWKHGGSPRSLRRYGAAMARVNGSLRGHLGEKILLWEVTHPNNLALAHLARRARYAIVALPQNLESLAMGKGPTDPVKLGRRMTAEIRALARTSAIFTISREEQWLLSLYGLPSDHLPYHPARELEQQLLAIRARRTVGKMNRLLLLGSFGNPPTAAGMLEQLRLLKSLPDGPSLPVDIAGSGTEALLPQVQGTQYKLHGTVDLEVLSGLLAQTRALLIHQSAAVGALTRIPEALVAGVPVIANPIAARSSVDLPGVHVYASATELHEVLQQPLLPPPPPPKPIQAGQRLIEAVTSLFQRNSLAQVPIRENGQIIN